VFSDRRIQIVGFSAHERHDTADIPVGYRRVRPWHSAWFTGMRQRRAPRIVMRSTTHLIRGLLVVTTIVWLAAPAQAQTFRSGPRVGAGVGGSFGDGGAAPAVALAGGYRFTPRIGLEVDASYSTKLDFGDVPACPPGLFCAAVVGGTLSMHGRALSVSGNFVSELPVHATWARIYLVGGGGFARVRFDQRHTFFGFSQTYISSGPMLTAGGGVDFPLGQRLVLGVDLRQQWLFPENEFGRSDLDSQVRLTRVGTALSVRF
jgi:hypothetical protein